MPSEALNETEAAEVCDRVAQFAGHLLPLATGLELAAQETSNPKVRRALARLSEATQAGVPIGEALVEIGPLLGNGVASIVGAGAESGKLTEVLTALHGDVKARQFVRRQVASVVVYPLLLLCSTAGVFLFTMLVVTPQFRSIFVDFGIRLPALTAGILWLSDQVAAVWLPFVVGLTAIVVVSTIALRRRRMEGVLHRVPMIGPVIRWSAEMSSLRLLGLLTEVDLPLPLALRHVAAASPSHRLAGRANAAARAVEEGRHDWWMTYGGETDVANLASLATIGAGKDRFSNACFAAAQLLEGRIRAALHQVRMIIPVAMLVLVILVAGTTVIGLVMPMIKLLNELGK